MSEGGARCTFAHVDLDALKSNFKAISKFIHENPAPRTRPSTHAQGVPSAVEGRNPAPGIVAVVKANAYGHGAAACGLALQEAGATMLAVADIEEAIVLRKAGVTEEILIFGALSVSDVEGVFDYNLTPTISTPTAGRALQAAAAKRNVTLKCHLKIDTGMNRLGLRFDNLRNTVPELVASKNLDIVAVYTHFATADDPDYPLFQEQRERFNQVIARLPELGVKPGLLHAANSAATLRDSRVWFDLVRPGLLMYGVIPPPLATTIDLKPVMSVRSRVVSVKGIRPGETVGYGAHWTAPKAGRIAVIPAGYADGLDLRLAGRGFVLIRGKRSPIVGSVCMDMIMVDVADVVCEPGDEAVIIGAQGDDRIDVREMAAIIGTNPYEILCRIGTRIERLYR